MAFRSLVNKFSRKFSNSRMEVILVEDFPRLGFEGQIIRVRPGYAAQYLIPNRIATYNFPGTHQRLYPNWDPESVAVKRQEYELKLFSKKLENMQLEISKIPSTTNPNFLKEPLKNKDVIEQARLKLNLEFANENIRAHDDIIKYGTYKLDIDEYFSEKFKKKFNFKLKVIISKPQA